MKMSFNPTVLLCTALCLITTAVATASSHDVSLTFGSFGTQSYSLDGFQPGDADLGASIGDADPTLTLHLGWRYQVTVTNFIFHPFEVLAKGGSVGQDTVLLSMGSAMAAPFENDPGVDWTDDGAGTVAFTLTLDLYNAMATATQGPGYRCKAHTTTMRGDFVVLGLPLDDPIPGPIEKGTIRIELETIAMGLAAPVLLTHAGDGTGRLFVVDQPGQIRIIADGVLLKRPFLDVADRLVPLGFFGTHHPSTDFDERGILGLAFHPGFADSQSAGYQKIYTYTSEPADEPSDFTVVLPPGADFDHQSVIAEWSTDVGDADVIDPSSRREIMRIDEPQFNHDGGMLAFGPDGYLYISLGDGGAANDTADGHGDDGNGQDPGNVLGTILRIDVDASDSANGAYGIPVDNPFVADAGVADEIYAYGFRNPWRFSFDSVSGDLIVGDVGQDLIEEIDIVTSGGNYGWNLKEGTFKFDPATGTVTDDLAGLPAGLIDPVAQYDHDEGTTVIGGFVYRGADIPELTGKYVFGDFSSGFSTPDGRLLYADPADWEIKEFVLGLDDRKVGLYVKAFGVDASGELYLLAGTNLGPFGARAGVFKIIDADCTPGQLHVIPGDANRDCRVDLVDLATTAGSWLECAEGPEVDCGI